MEEWRQRLSECVEKGDVDSAVKAAKSILQQESHVSRWSFIKKIVRKCGLIEGRLRKLKVAFLSSFSSEFLHDPLIAYAFTEGLHLEIYQAPFGAFRQEFLDPSSGLYAFEPDVVILAVEGQAWVPSIYRCDVNINVEEDACFAERVCAELSQLIQKFRNYSDATILVHDCASPTWKRLGILDGHFRESPVGLVHRLNESFYRLAREMRGVYIVDYSGLVARFGSYSWFDDRMAHYARSPIAQGMFKHLAKEYLKFLRALTGKSKKCLVVDLDNTLWGGVIGEESVHEIKLGLSYPGSAYVEFQRVILNLLQRGVILAIASKNNVADVDAVFSDHQYMVLKKDQFASSRINWNPKTKSLVEISQELNIALDHMVFVDDNPAECELVSQALPAVTVISLGDRPELFPRLLLEDGLFDTVTFSAEDQRRADLYRQRASVETLRLQSSSLEDFYRSLQMTAEFAPVKQSSLARAAQLTQKTNQFNATTIRFTEADLVQRMGDHRWVLITVQIGDRFGDHGIVGLMMAREVERDLIIDTFLLSCRVIGRTIETAMLAWLAGAARGRGLTRVVGRIVPTAKNQPVRDLFERHGFQQTTVSEDGQSVWAVECSSHEIPFPEWIQECSGA